MEEANFGKTIFPRAHFFRMARRLARRFAARPRLAGESGQGFLEFLLVIALSLIFLRFVFFNQKYGMKASLDRTMLTFGSYLEANLKTGTKPGGDGTKSLEAFAGTRTWKN